MLDAEPRAQDTTELTVVDSAIPKKSNQSDRRYQLGREAGALLVQMSGRSLSEAAVADTPERVGKAWIHLLSGYQKTPAEAVGRGIFPAEGSGLVWVESTEFYSQCEHHLLPFMGEVSVGYFPRDKILGLSKVPRLIEVFARRLQVQERMTRQVAEAIVELIDPRAVVVRSRAKHMCMAMRGIEKQASETETIFSLGLDQLDDIERSTLMKKL